MTGRGQRRVWLALTLATGLAGALGARALGLPIPFLLGSLCATAALAITVHARGGARLWFPQPMRRIAVGVIGTMIGTTFSPALVTMAGSLVLTLSAMIPFILIAQMLGYAVFRGLGRYDPVTATYAAMPGGLIEAVAIGEAAGGKPEVLGLQHFVRIVLVVLAVPTMFYLWTGEVVGSQAGQTLQKAPTHWPDWAAFVAIVPAGLWIGARLRLPAAHLTGPLVLTALLHGVGVLDMNGPGPLLAAAQLVVGSGLGVMFARSTLRQMAAGFALGLVAVSAMLAVSLGFAALLDPFVPMRFATLLVSFAPGGVTEMSLIALSLGVSPVLVAAHHLFRILATVVLAGFLSRRF